MRFLSHAERKKYVVSGYPRRKVMDPTTGVVTPYPGLEARFLNHVFDSETMQQRLGWTNEQRKTVENYLLGHADFDRPSGIYLEVADGERKADLVEAGTKPRGKKRCTAWFRNERNESELCPNDAEVGTELCVMHSPAVLEDDQGGPEPEEPVVSITAGEAETGRSTFLPLAGVR